MSKLPPLTLLTQQKASRGSSPPADLLLKALEAFRAKCTVESVIEGPTITRFELAPAPGVSVRRIMALADDLALALRAESVRIIPHIPGKGVLGIEVPADAPATIALREVLSSPTFLGSRAELPIALGVDVENKVIVTDLAEMPHLLVAGTTGSGKSVCLNTIIGSLLYRYDPNGLRFLMVDPKRVELSVYNGLPHLRHEVVTTPAEALLVLDWAIAEMEQRYVILSENKCRNLEEYNNVYLEKVVVSISKTLPYIVIIVDELADLLMVEPSIEERIIRLAQKARAVGIHLVAATQRPSADVITGLIKSNFPSRIAFRVFSQVDSRVIMDEAGAEKLIGHGDMLFLSPRVPLAHRIQGAYVSTEETVALVDWWKNNAKQPDDKPITHEESQKAMVLSDPLVREAAELAVAQGAVSCADLLKGFKTGFARAQQVMDKLVQMQVIGPEPLEDGRHPCLVVQEELKRMIL